MEGHGLDNGERYRHRDRHGDRQHVGRDADLLHRQLDDREPLLEQQRLGLCGGCDNIEVKVTATGPSGNNKSWRVRFRY